VGAEPSSVEWALGQPWPRFLIDHNNPWIFGPALRQVGYAVVGAFEVGLHEADDEEVIRFCGENGLVWVTEDVDARRRGQYVELVRKHKVSAIILRPPRGKGWSTKMKFEVIARNIQGLEQALTNRRPRYFICPERRPPREVPSFAATFRAQRRK
jgi:predicted nuclease of predicted toxin-antitoxin system